MVWNPVSWLQSQSPNTNQFGTTPMAGGAIDPNFGAQNPNFSPVAVADPFSGGGGGILQQSPTQFNPGGAAAPAGADWGKMLGQLGQLAQPQQAPQQANPLWGGFQQGGATSYDKRDYSPYGPVKSQMGLLSMPRTNLRSGY